MAYAALVSLAQTTDLILNPLKYSVSVDAEHKIMCIHDYAVFVLSFLEDFPAKANRFEAPITEAANGAEDILEYFMWNQIRDVGDESGIEFEYQLEKATGEISSIGGELLNIKKSLRTEGEVAAVLTPRNSSTGNNDIIMGLDDDLIAIKGRLCGGSSKLEVIPIVGMGGIGKTTLAKSAYNDALIIEYFDIRAWVTVSQDYSVDETLSSLVDSLKLLEKNTSLMAEKVYKCLKGMRYLIVMDDVWSTKACDDVWNIFPDDNNGSRILLTTRLSDVAAYPISNGTPVHEMKFMDENQSWNLLQQKIFTNGQNFPPELEDIGKAIARGCRGLPLAVVLVAGILPTIAKTRASWKEIAENVISVVDGQMEKILSLSYTHLPHHLRACFLYIGGFPEDYEIRASRLTKLWVAEGFLKCENGCKSLEEEAEKCLEDLVRRSLVLVNRKVTGEIKNCSLHDLVRDSCIRKAQEEKFLLHVMDRYNLETHVKNNHPRRISTISHRHFKKFQGPTIHSFSGALDPACIKKIVKIIPNLKKLEIYFEKRTVYALNFKYLDQLEKLKLVNVGGYCQWDTHAFPMMLKNLSLVGSLFSWNCMSIIGSLPHLQVLKLRVFFYSDSLIQTWETADGEFPQLRFLEILDPHLGYWITESSHFPRLKCLVLRCCWSLHAIPDGIGNIPTLELIDVSCGKKSLADSAKQIQQEQQQDYENYNLQVSCSYVIGDSE